MSIFQSTLPREERQRTNSRKMFEFSISIHAPTRGATTMYYHSKSTKRFQSTLPREERPSLLHDVFPPFQAFQSTLPREERPSLRLATIHRTFISIHAPTRGATDFVTANATFFVISIHAPTRGATLFHSLSNTVTFISIHAPTRGATAILHKKFVYFYTIPTINI